MANLCCVYSTILKKRTIYYTEIQTIKIKNKKSGVFCYVNLPQF